MMNMLKYCSRGVDVWNKWREEYPGVRPDLDNIIIIRTNLKGANLSGVMLGNANLIYSDLSSTDLSNANFSGADLTDADLTAITIDRKTAAHTKSLLKLYNK